MANRCDIQNIIWLYNIVQISLAEGTNCTVTSGYSNRKPNREHGLFYKKAMRRKDAHQLVIQHITENINTERYKKRHHTHKPLTQIRVIVMHVMTAL